MCEMGELGMVWGLLCTVRSASGKSRVLSCRVYIDSIYVGFLVDSGNQVVPRFTASLERRCIYLSSWQTGQRVNPCTRVGRSCQTRQRKDGEAPRRVLFS